MDSQSAVITRHALLRHERGIADAGLRTMARNPLDLATVIVAVPIALLVARAWLAAQPDQLKLAQAFAVGLSASFFSLTALFARCSYHRTDGIVAAAAQRRAERLGLIVPLLGLAMAFGLLGLLSVGAFRLEIWALGSALGAVLGIGWIPGLALIERLRAKTTTTLRVWLPDTKAGQAIPIAGVTFGLVGAFLPLQLPVRMVAAVAIVLVAAIALARIDAGVVRYETMLGHASAKLLRAHLWPFSLLVLSFATASLAAPHWGQAAAGLVAGAAILVFAALRILAYQSFGQRGGDWIVTLLIGGAAMTGLAMPPLGPLMLIVGIVWLARRARAQSWLIA